MTKDTELHHNPQMKESMNPIMTKAAIEYTLRCLFSIANPLGTVPYVVHVSDDGDKRIVSADLDVNTKHLKFYLSPDSDWYALTGEENVDLIWIDNHTKTMKIPMLFWGEKGKPFTIQECEDTIEIYGDIISSSFFMLSRWEETLDTPLDTHQRYQYIHSASYRYDFISIPVVDEYALLLRQMLSKLLPSVELGKNTFKVKLSHDIDEIRRFPTVYRSARTIIGDIVRVRKLSVVLNSIKEFFITRKYPKRDPLLLAILELAELSEHHGLSSAFYFKTAKKSDHDSGYDIYFAKDVIDTLLEKGFEVGFHPGYYTLDDYDRFCSEKAVLDEVLGNRAYGGRQHYLRFNIHSTLKYWSDAGLLYDSTLSYAEQEGFRCGTCHPYRFFDLANDCELNIIEYPLIIMDGTLNGYRGLSTEQALDAIITLANACKAVEGTFTLLWHNGTIHRDWKPWFEHVYKPALVVLEEMSRESQ